jgi:DNA-binding transcriptional regulator YiaG
MAHENHKNNNVGNQTANMKLVEELYSLKHNKPMTIAEIMRMLYVDKHMTQKEIAQELHVSVGTVNAWLMKSAISSRRMIWI